MFGENASFIKSVEIDDSIFQCDLDCSEKYLLQLERSTDNETWQWKVMKKSDVLWGNSSNWGKSMMAMKSSDDSSVLDAINDLNNRIVALEVDKENAELDSETTETKDETSEEK